ncbi:hypothetical protein ElyMa_003679300 [Elysia marginata]|uniref:Transmembrane protein n=1 Tax=Elysia marginata TaxID=1093978 RepID=A0AAV4F0R2_9GAST|nr:hypothetical protein ElyMa_003679300 [Elysia marginata]
MRPSELQKTIGLRERIAPNNIIEEPFEADALPRRHTSCAKRDWLVGNHRRFAFWERMRLLVKKSKHAKARQAANIGAQKLTRSVEEKDIISVLKRLHMNSENAAELPPEDMSEIALAKMDKRLRLWSEKTNMNGSKLAGLQSSSIVLVSYVAVLGSGGGGGLFVFLVFVCILVYLIIFFSSTSTSSFIITIFVITIFYMIVIIIHRLLYH